MRGGGGDRAWRYVTLVQEQAKAVAAASGKQSNRGGGKQKAREATLGLEEEPGAYSINCQDRARKTVKSGFHFISSLHFSTLFAGMTPRRREKYSEKHLNLQEKRRYGKWTKKHGGRGFVSGLRGGGSYDVIKIRCCFNWLMWRLLSSFVLQGKGGKSESVLLQCVDGRLRRR